MKYCPNCGAQLNDDAEFCGKCGTSLLEDGMDMSRRVEPQYDEIRETPRHASHEPEYHSHIEASQVSNKLRYIQIVLLSVLIVIVAGGGGFIWYTYSHSQINTRTTKIPGKVQHKVKKRGGGQKGQLISGKGNTNPNPKPKPSPSDDPDSYILPNGGATPLYDSDVSDLSKPQLRLARNEIFARHGYEFKDQDLQDYFDKKSWYTPVTDDEEEIYKDELSQIEKDNIDLIKQYENS